MHPQAELVGRVQEEAHGARRRKWTRCVTLAVVSFMNAWTHQTVLQGTSYISTNTDDDDISAFVQDIDARKPLTSRREGSESPAGSRPLSPFPHAREATIREESESGLSGHSSDVPLRQRAVSTPYPGPVLDSERAIDERLSEMKEAFILSLQGFGSGSRRRETSSSTETADRPGSTSAAAGRRPLDPIAYSGGARRDSPLDGESAPPSPQPDSVGSSAAGGIPLPQAYRRPRLGSTGSVRSGFSIASEEVIGRMDPEPGSDERRRSRGPLGGGA